MQSDKATVEITSRYGGVVKILHHMEGSIVKVRSEIDMVASITSC